MHKTMTHGSQSTVPLTGLRSAGSANCCQTSLISYHLRRPQICHLYLPTKHWSLHLSFPIGFHLLIWASSIVFFVSNLPRAGFCVVFICPLHYIRYFLVHISCNSKLSITVIQSSSKSHFVKASSKNMTGQVLPAVWIRERECTLAKSSTKPRYLVEEMEWRPGRWLLVAAEDTISLR